MARMFVMVAAILIFAGTARADTVATACLKANGTIYNFNAYRSQPMRGCRANEQTIRFQLLQDDTAVAKRSATVTRGEVSKMTTFSVPGDTVDSDVEILFGYPGEEPSEDCELWALHDEIIYRLVKVAPHESADRFRDALVFSQDQDPDEDPSLPVVETEQLIRGGNPDTPWALKAHDLFVVNSGEVCFAFFLIEFADDEAKLYAK